MPNELQRKTLENKSCSAISAASSGVHPRSSGSQQERGIAAGTDGGDVFTGCDSGGIWKQDTVSAYSPSSSLMQSLSHYACTVALVISNSLKRINKQK